MILWWWHQSAQCPGSGRFLVLSALSPRAPAAANRAPSPADLSLRHSMAHPPPFRCFTCCCRALAVSSSSPSTVMVSGSGSLQNTPRLISEAFYGWLTERSGEEVMLSLDPLCPSGKHKIKPPLPHYACVVSSLWVL